MTRALLFLLPASLAAVALYGAPALAQPCSCTKYQSTQQFVQFTDVIFKGRAVSSNSQYGVTTTTFALLERLKGEPAQSQAVTHPAPRSNSCGGVAFKPGQVVVIVAQGRPDDLATTACQINAYTEAQLKAALR
jgi:hypothetical protein